MAAPAAVRLLKGGASLEVALSSLESADGCGAALRRAAAAAFGLELSTVKLVLRGRLVGEAAAASELAGATVLVTGSTQAAISGVRSHATFRVRDDLDGAATAAAAASVAAAMAAARRTPAHDARAAGFGFAAVTVLPGLPHREQALAYLIAIADDPGVLAVMRARRWLVGELREMYPAGSVGEDPVCVLGLNVNHGERIELRIRTDDLAGFRKRETVMKTVYHELAHNVRSEHDGVFYDLVSELTREGDAGDWTKTRGYVLDEGAAFHEHGGIVIAANSIFPPLAAATATATVAAAAGAGTGVGATGGVFVLGGGGGGGSGEVSLPDDAVAAAASAAAARVHRASPGAAPAAPPAAPPVAVLPAAPLPTPPSELDAETAALLASDPALAAAAAAVADRARRVEGLAGRLMADARTAGVEPREAVSTVLGLLQRAGETAAALLSDGAAGSTPVDRKYLSVRPSNMALRRRTGHSDAVRDLLQAAGFVAGVNDAGEEVLTLPAGGGGSGRRWDAAALWLVVETLTMAAAAL